MSAKAYATAISAREIWNLSKFSRRAFDLINAVSWPNRMLVFVGLK